MRKIRYCLTVAILYVMQLTGKAQCQKGLFFDGIDDKVTINTNALTLSDFSVDFIFRTDSNSNQEQTLYIEGVSGLGLKIFLDTSGYLKAIIDGDTVNAIAGYSFYNTGCKNCILQLH